MDPLKLNLFSNVNGIQQIQPSEESEPQEQPIEESAGKIDIDTTPDTEGLIDASSMSLNFDDKLKKLQ